MGNTSSTCTSSCGSADRAIASTPRRSCTLVGGRRGSLTNSGTLVARNGTLTYRPVGARRHAVPRVVFGALRGKAGVCALGRDADSHEVLYVGSSASRLYATITRHFQQWRRYKGFWRGQLGEGHDPGLTYDRDAVEVATRITGRRAHRSTRRCDSSRALRPRDNLLASRPTRNPSPSEHGEDVHGRHLAGSQSRRVAGGDASHSSTCTAARPASGPLAVLNGREPVVLGTAVSRHFDDHEGVEPAYPRVDEDDAATTCPINTPNGTATHIMPAMTPALAVDDGSIIWAGTLGHGYSVTICITAPAGPRTMRTSNRSR